jgi:hypothetical protein
LSFSFSAVQHDFVLQVSLCLISQKEEIKKEALDASIRGKCEN